MSAVPPQPLDAPAVDPAPGTAGPGSASPGVGSEATVEGIDTTPLVSGPTLRDRLLRHVLVPLAAAWLLGTLVVVGIAGLFTQRAFDRSLLDDAYLLASNVHLADGRLALDLSPRELKTALFDQAEQAYFSVRDPGGLLIAGEPELRVGLPAAALYEFEDITLRGRRLRAVSLHMNLAAPFSVVVAQTTGARDEMLRQLLLYSLLPQGLLFLALAVWLHRGITRDMQPLARLEQALENRDSHDLAPIQVRATTYDLAALTAAINALLQRLGRSLRAQREFAGNVAHELRTPLAGIRALADYALSHEDPRVWREQLTAITRSEQRASRLVDKLLSLAVAAEAEAGLQLQTLALDALVREAVLRFLPRADAAGLDLGAQGLEQPTRVVGDPTLVEGILGNLLDNALRYAVSPQTPHPVVTVAIERTAHEVVLSVQDNGPGLPDEQQARLVDRGAQGETGHLLGQGAGLGLALVAQYARLMKARMSLGRPEDGCGWVCRIHFPAL